MTSASRTAKTDNVGFMKETTIMSSSIKLEKETIGQTSLKRSILGSLFVGALVTLLSAPVLSAEPSPLDDHSDGQPASTFVILLSGPYHPVVHGPNLGLSQVNLSDGSYSTTKIYPVAGLPREDSSHAERGSSHPGESVDDTEKAIGNFYVQFAGTLVAYDLPGGAIDMVFTENDLKQVSDGQGGNYFIGTLKLDILEAAGIYRSFVGGHNQMVDILHQLADGTFVEHCFCIISRPLQTAGNQLPSHFEDDVDPIV